MNPRILAAFEGKRVLITGGAGAIGSNLVRRLNALETKQIIILDDLSSSYAWNVPQGPKIVFLKGSVLDEGKLRAAFHAKPQIVYHLAAHFANQNSVDNPETDLMVNGMGTLKTLQYSHRAGVDRFIYASSGCGIYGADSKIPFDEDDVSVKLYTPYQVTKMLGELYTNQYRNLYGLPIVNARFFNSYGPGEVPGKYRNVIPNFFYWALNKQTLPITGTGDETRDYTYVNDIVDGLLAMAYYDEAVGEAFNLASEKETKTKDLAHWINELTANESGIVLKERRNWDKKTRLFASIEKAKRILGYEPKMDFREGLKQVHQWFTENWNRIQESAEF